MDATAGSLKCLRAEAGGTTIQMRSALVKREAEFDVRGLDMDDGRPMSDPLAIRVVVNPVSGRAGRRDVLATLCRRVKDAGWLLRIHETRGPEDGSKIASRSCREGLRALVVVGGDGTISEAVRGMRREDVPILVVPQGTENILAKYLGLRADGDWLWQVLRDGRERALDVPAMNDRQFLLIGGVGFDAEAVRRVAMARRGHISYLTYFWPLWRTLWGDSYPPVSVEVDGRQVHEGPALVFVGNVPRYAVGIRILENAVPDDGLLDVCVLPCDGPRNVLRHAVNVLLKRHLRSRGVIYKQARHVHVWADRPTPVQLDGDVAGWLPAEFEMTGKRVRFLVADA